LVKNESIPVNQVFEAVSKNHKLPTNDKDFSSYILDGMGKCQKLAQIKHKKKPSQLGRANGDWFEFFLDKIFTKKIQKTQYIMPVRQKITFNQLQGFEKVDWIPKPDIIIRNFKDVRGLVSVKWTMRHDRMYESAYEAAAVKNWIHQNKLRGIKIFLLTNDFASSRLKIMLKVPELDGVYHIQPEKYPNVDGLKSLIELIYDLKKL